MSPETEGGPDTSVTRENAYYILEFCPKDLKKLQSSPMFNDKNCRVNVEGNEVLIGCGINEFSQMFPSVLSKKIDTFTFDEMNDDLPFDAPSNIKNPNLIQRQKDLVSEAEKYMAQFSPVEGKKVLPDTQQTPKQVLLDMIQNNEGVTIGECHDHASPKKLLIDNMANLKEAGVTTLFLEHVYEDTHAHLLEEYFNSDSNIMPPRLALHLRAQDRGNFLKDPCSFFGLVIAAKMHGIRIVPVDTTFTHARNRNKFSYEGGDNNRMLMMNHFAMQQFEKNKLQNSDSKYIFLVGSSHINDANCGVKGISDLTGSPSLVVEDIRTDAPSPDSAEKHIAKPNVLLRMDSDNTLADSLVNEAIEQNKQSIEALFERKIHKQQLMPEVPVSFPAFTSGFNPAKKVNPSPVTASQKAQNTSELSQQETEKVSKVKNGEVVQSPQGFSEQDRRVLLNTAHGENNVKKAIEDNAKKLTAESFAQRLGLCILQANEGEPVDIAPLLEPYINSSQFPREIAELFLTTDLVNTEELPAEKNHVHLALTDVKIQLKKTYSKLSCEGKLLFRQSFQRMLNEFRVPLSRLRALKGIVNSYPYGKAGLSPRSHHSPATLKKGIDYPIIGDKSKTGDVLKRDILEAFLKRIQSCHTKENLNEVITQLKKSAEYDILKTPQGITSRLLNLDTDSIKAFKEMEKEAQIKLDEDVSTHTKASSEPTHPFLLDNIYALRKGSGKLPTNDSKGASRNHRFILTRLEKEEEEKMLIYDPDTVSFDSLLKEWSIDAASVVAQGDVELKEGKVVGFSGMQEGGPRLDNLLHAYAFFKSCPELFAEDANVYTQRNPKEFNSTGIRHNAPGLYGSKASQFFPQLLEKINQSLQQSLKETLENFPTLAADTGGSKAQIQQWVVAIKNAEFPDVQINKIMKDESVLNNPALKEKFRQLSERYQATKQQCEQEIMGSVEEFPHSR